MSFLPCFAIGFTLFVFASSLNAALSPDELRALLGNRDAVDWSAEQPENWSVAGDRSALWSSARNTLEEIDVVPFDDALDADQEFSVDGWVGLAEADEAFDDTDAAWSFLTGPDGSNTASMTLPGPAKIRFRWRSSGTGSLRLRVDGAGFPVAAPGGDWQEVEFELYDPALIEWVHVPTTETNDAAMGEAWLDTLTIQSVPPRTIDEVAGEGSGLVFESTAGATEEEPWRAAAYRDATGTWREGVRGIGGGTNLQTTVTGPALLSFRTYCAQTFPPRENAPAPQPTINHTNWFLSVRVGDSEKLRIRPRRGGGWTDHLIHVPVGEHTVVWQRGGVTRAPSSEELPEWQAWLGDVTLQNPRAHYDAWTADFFENSTAREPEEDADGDGVINFLEYAYSSDPENALSKPAEIFGVVERPALVLLPPDYVIDVDIPHPKFVLHVPHLPPHVTAVLETSADLVTWTPSPIPLRSFHVMALDTFFPYPRHDYDSETHQVIVFDILPEQPANFFRVKLDLPENRD